MWLLYACCQFVKRRESASFQLISKSLWGYRLQIHTHTQHWFWRSPFCLHVYTVTSIWRSLPNGVQFMHCLPNINWRARTTHTWKHLQRTHKHTQNTCSASLGQSWKEFARGWRQMTWAVCWNITAFAWRSPSLSCLFSYNCCLVN
jgi:hypothetical protein